MLKFPFAGAGDLYGYDIGAAVPTPVKFGTVQDITLEISFSHKELFGTKQLAESVLRAEGKMTGKAKFANIQADVIGNLFLGIAPITGSILPIKGEAGTIPNTPGPYTITVANGANFRKDLGVWFTATGAQLTRVAAAPAAGQYAVNESTGVYTFAEADKQLAVKFDYLYNAAASGKTITIVNEESQEAPYFMIIFTGTYQGKSIVLILNKCTSNKLSLPTKRGDFTIQEFDFAVQADDNDEIGTLSLPG
jgi:hypothetical protein